MNLTQFHSSNNDFGGVVVEDTPKVSPKTFPLETTSSTQIETHSVQTTTTIKVVPIESNVSPWFSNIAYPVGRYIVLPLYFGTIEVTGQENLPQNAPVILAPTHRSRWDAFMVPYAAGRDITGRDLRFMVSANEMKGLQGWVIRKFGGFPIDPKHPGISSIRHGVELLKHQETLVIFPEGNIYRDNDIQPLKPGLARMAIQAESSQPGLGVKIVPISIKYSQTIPKRGCDIQIRIGTAIEVANYLNGSAKQNANQLTSDLQAALKHLHVNISAV